MSRSHINQLRSHLIRIIVVALCCATHALAADNVAVAKAAVTDLYPELKSQDLHVAISEGGLLDTPGPFTNFIMLIQHPAREIVTGRCPVPVLSVGFTFSAAGSDQRIFSLSAAGPAVNTDRLEQITRQVDFHPEWSDSEVLKVLTKEGARFGPSAKKELLDKLTLNGLKALVGDIRVDSAEFEIRNAAQVREHLPSSVLMWTVKIEGQSDGRDLKYYAVFEPFDGKLISLGRVPPVLWSGRVVLT